MNKALISTLLCTLMSPSLLQAAAPELAVDFYRGTRSPFPSGQAHQKTLEKNKVRDSFEFSYMVEHGKKKFWVDAISLARDIQLSQKALHVPSKKVYQVLDSKGYWLLVKKPEDASSQWMPISDFSSLPYDKGVAVNLIATPLRDGPQWKSQSLINLPALSRLEVIDFEETWAKVRFQSGGSLVGYVDLNNLLLKSDFASFVITSEKKWIPVKYREGENFVGMQNQRIPLSLVQGMMTRSDLAVVIKSDDSKNLLLRQHLNIQKIEADVWSVSRLSGHGEVFWKRKSSTVTFDDASSGISNDEILKKEIYSVSFDEKNPNFGIISANGIFMTTDGKKWTQLKQFQNQNHPVLIGKDGKVFVGSYWSRNLGKSFEPYIKWEYLARLIQEQLRVTPKELKLSELAMKDSNILKIQVDTGAKKLSFASKLIADSPTKWELF